jgi:glycosyltransferase involved in cell wall biosynthesis
MHHLEHVPHEEIDSVIRCADVFIAGSRSEGMPHAVCEAMLGGLPMLLSDIEGHRAMATPEIDALFFATRNDFLRQVMRLRNEPGLPTVLARNSMERARKNVSDNREMKEYLEFFENILERCSKSRLL